MGKIQRIADALVRTTPETLQKIEEYARAGRFNEHLDPIDTDEILPVEADFPYILHGARAKVRNWLNWWVIRPFCSYANRELLHTRVVGRENLKGIKSAIVTCNHVNKLDTVAIMRAVKGRKLRFVAASFNNRKGLLGDMMRSAGLLPLGTNFGGQKAFERAVSYYLERDTLVLVFPEQSEWWCYEKPRPYLEGAFRFAVRNRVPVLPLFITFTPSGRRDENGVEFRDFCVHILPPLRADETRSVKEASADLRDRNFAACVACYEETYGVSYQP